MKKAPFLLTLIFLLGLASKPVNATSTTLLPSDEIWWSVKELAAYYNQRNAERENRCFDDVVCHDEAINSDLMDAEYVAGRTIFYKKRFAIASINRETSDMEVYYNNDDLEVSKYNPGWRDSDLKRLYVGWFEEDPDQLFNLSYTDTATAGTGQHTLIDQTNSSGLFPSQAFISIAFNNDLAENHTGLIGYAVGSTFFRGRELLDFSTCLDNPNWTSCDLYVSSSGEARYFATVDLEEPGPDVEEPDPNLPPEIDEPTVEEPTIEPDPEPSHLEINQITAPSEAPAEAIATTTTGTTIETTTEPTVESTEKGNETSSVDIPLTSNVVTNTAKKCAKSEFPWWFIVLVLAGDAIILWFFMPKPQKTR
jgi:hypothetical protein